MAVTTTVRVSTETRDLLKRLSRRQKISAGETITELVHAADDDMLLADAEAGFQRMAGDPRLLAAYRDETAGLADSFDAPLPEW
jgi:hypothetical protein